LSQALHFRGIEVQKLLQCLQAQGRIWQAARRSGIYGGLIGI
jgi:hypothetical protein